VATVSKPAYTALCRRVGGWWAIDVAQVRRVHTQARRLDQVEAMTRDVVALIRDVPPDTFQVVVEPHVDDDADHAVAASEAATRRAREVAEEANRLQREAVAILLNKHRLTVRDAGMLLHVSPQRISQLAHRSNPSASTGVRGRLPNGRKAG
jgi:hypothetical protein